MQELEGVTWSEIRWNWNLCSAETKTALLKVLYGKIHSHNPKSTSLAKDILFLHE